MPPRRQPPSELHRAVLHGSPELTAAIIASGLINIDQGDPRGSTPLMYCSLKGYVPVARVLLDRGADVSLSDEDGFTALHVTAQNGHEGLSTLLLKAGASLEAATSDGSTPLHLCSQKGNLGVMRLLIEAGADVDSQSSTGATPLYLAAEECQAAAIRELLRAKANPMLVAGDRFAPLDMSTQNGDAEAVRALVGHAGIEGCGGDSGGSQALRLAAEEQHIDIMRFLMAAGAADTGGEWGTVALNGAAEYGRERSTKLLLEQCARKPGVSVRAYVNSRDPLTVTPLLASIKGCRPGAARVARMLIDAGADTAAAAPVLNSFGIPYFHGTPLAAAKALLSRKEVDGEPATEQQLHSLQAIRRLLLRVSAVRAVSWLWAIDVPRIDDPRAAAEGAAPGEQAPSAPLAPMLPTLRRRTGKRGVLVAGLFRYARKR